MKFFRQLVKKLVFRFVHYLRSFTNRIPNIHGDPGRVQLGDRVSAMNTLFNVASGSIKVGDDTIFGHNCIVASGVHVFEKGMRRKILHEGKVGDTPLSGFDIEIGKGCWIASGAIITGGVSIGDNTIIGAGSVVTKDIPSGVFAGGIPARVIKKHEDNILAHA